MRKKVKLAFIVQDASRKATYNKRKNGLLKKISELSILCDIPACAIIYGDNGSKLDLWPSSPVLVHQVVSRFLELPMNDQRKKMVNQEVFLKERISRAEEQLKKFKKENMDMEMACMMLRDMAGLLAPGWLQRLTMADLTNLEWVIDQTLNQVNQMHKKLSELASEKRGKAIVNVATTLVESSTSKEPMQTQEFTDTMGPLEQLVQPPENSINPSNAMWSNLGWVIDQALNQVNQMQEKLSEKTFEERAKAVVNVMTTPVEASTSKEPLHMEECLTNPMDPLKQAVQPLEDVINPSNAMWSNLDWVIDQALKQVNQQEKLSETVSKERGKAVINVETTLVEASTSKEPMQMQECFMDTMDPLEQVVQPLEGGINPSKAMWSNLEWVIDQALKRANQQEKMSETTFEERAKDILNAATTIVEASTSKEPLHEQECFMDLVEPLEQVVQPLEYGINPSNAMWLNLDRMIDQALKQVNQMQENMNETTSEERTKAVVNTAATLVETSTSKGSLHTQECFMDPMDPLEHALQPHNDGINPSNAM